MDRNDRLMPKKDNPLICAWKVKNLMVSWTNLFSNGVLADKDEKDETASEKVNTSYDSEKELSV